MSFQQFQLAMYHALKSCLYIFNKNKDNNVKQKNKHLEMKLINYFMFLTLS